MGAWSDHVSADVRVQRLVNLACASFPPTLPDQPFYERVAGVGPLYLPYTQLGAVVVALLLTYLVYLF
jgi:hypothetical protein